MATTALGGEPVHTVGEPPRVGDAAPDYRLVGHDFTEVAAAPGTVTVLNVFPSVDTGVCATSVRTFNSRAAELEGARVVCVSADLPFALARFCSAEGIDDLVVASSFRSRFGDDYGLRLVDGGFEALLARAVLVVDADGVVQHVQLVGEIGSEPDYDTALEAARTAARAATGH